jgi:hypothetical protein
LQERIPCYTQLPKYTEIADMSKHTYQQVHPEQVIRWALPFFAVCLLRVPCDVNAQPAGGPPTGVRMLELFRATENGQTLVVLSYRDSVMYPMLESRKEMTELYARFWENERFAATRDLNVEILPDGVNRAGIVVVLEMRQKVMQKDPGFEMHRRFGQMLVSYCKNKTGGKAPIIWKVAVDTTYGDDQIRRSSVATAFGSRFKYIYQDPAARDSVKIYAMEESGGRNVAMQAIDLAYTLASGLQEELVKSYAPLLGFDGLKYGQDATLLFKKNPIDQNSVLLLFELGPRARKIDPQLTMHKDLAEKMVKRLNDHLKPIAPAWLDFKAAADTTGGKSPYVLLVTYVR